MKTKFSMSISVIATLFIAFASLVNSHAQSPVSKYGQLKVTGNRITDAAGNSVQLRGMSTFWSNSDVGAPFYNANTINWLRDDWCIDVIRVAMGVETLGGVNGYLNAPDTEYNKVKTIIDAAIAKGIYVIVDFHSHNAETNTQKSAAKAFFKRVAEAYGDKPNIIYETFNEPIYQSWSTLKSYHNEMVSYIRQYDPDNIIICGTRSYSREVEEASLDKVTGTNIAYTLHFYAGGGDDHNSQLKDKVTRAMNNGAAIFCTEYGTCDPSGNGSYNAGNTNSWWSFLDEKKISHCNWSIANKNETASILKPGITNQGNWSTGDLTTSGALVRTHLKSKCNTSTGSISFTAPANNASFDAGVAINFTVNATVSAGGNIAKVEFVEGNTILSTDNSAPYSFNTSTLSIGTHTIVAKSYDASGVLLATSSNLVILIKGASDISSKGVIDMFETEDPISRLTGGYKSNTCATSQGIKEAATMGVYWYEDKDAATPFKSSLVRAGDNKIVYTISQELGAYEPIGFNFGEYCNGTTKTKYSLDLSSNAVMKMTLKAPASNTVALLEVKIQMRDANGVNLVFDKAYKATGVPASESWKYDIGLSKNHTLPLLPALKKDTPVNFEYDFKNALSVSGYTYPDDINSSSAPFDFTKVTEILITLVNSADNGQAGGYKPLALVDQKIEISNLTIGNLAAGTPICTTPALPLAKTVPAICQGTPAAALSTTGTDYLDLVWYGTSATGGTGSLTPTQPSTTTAGTQSYYVSQRVPESTCEGPRRAISVTVTPSTVPAVSIASNAPNNTINSGNSISFTATPTNGGTSPSYEWSVNGNTIEGVSGSTFTTTTLNDGDEVEVKMIPDVVCSNPATINSSSISVIVTPVGIAKNAKELGLKLYPNPASSQLVLEGLGNEFEFQIWNTAGLVVKSGKTTNGTISIDGLENGPYVLLTNGISHKFVKN